MGSWREQKVYNSPPSIAMFYSELLAPAVCSMRKAIKANEIGIYGKPISGLDWNDKGQKKNWHTIFFLIDFKTSSVNYLIVPFPLGFWLKQSYAPYDSYICEIEILYLFGLKIVLKIG